MSSASSFQVPYSLIQTLDSNKASVKKSLSLFGNPSVYHPEWHVDTDSQQEFIRSVFCSDE